MFHDGKRLHFCGQIKGGSSCNNYDTKSFTSDVKLISAGKMNMTVVLADNKILMWGVSKGQHFEGDKDPSDSSWTIAKIATDFDPASDSIVDICSGNHFTLFATSKGKLYASGMFFFDEIGF